MIRTFKQIFDSRDSEIIPYTKHELFDKKYGLLNAMKPQLYSQQR